MTFWALRVRGCGAVGLLDYWAGGWVGMGGLLAHNTHHTFIIGVAVKYGATTLSIMTLSIMAVNIWTTGIRSLFVILSIIIPCHYVEGCYAECGIFCNAECHYGEYHLATCHYAEWHFLNVIMLNVVYAECH
jgi:hypothetical protein